LNSFADFEFSALFDDRAQNVSVGIEINIYLPLHTAHSATPRSATKAPLTVSKG